MALNFNIQEIAEICDGRLTTAAQDDIEIQSISFDSRKIVDARHCLFFALVTERNNGHKYLIEAYEKGVRAFVVSEEVKLPSDALVIIVKNTLKASHTVVGCHRGKFNYPILGITGSNGKTIVKEWLYQGMHSKFKIARSPKSYNSQIGVPLSLSLLNAWNDLGIIEAGISRKNEMVNLAQIIQPTHGLITNVKEAHSTGFVNNKEKLKEKLLLFKECETLFYCKDDLDIAQEIEASFFDTELISWSSGENAVLKSLKTEIEGNSTRISGHYLGNKVEIQIPFADSASIENAIHTWLIALHFGLSPKEISAEMAQLQSVDMRLNIVRGQQGSVLISDYYNSDPSSVQIALETLQQQSAVGNKIVVLSSFEQIEYSTDLYDSVFEMIEGKSIDQIFLIGKEWERFKERDKVIWYNTTNELLIEISRLKLSQAVVLLKGARQFSFEKIADLIAEKKHETFLEVNMESLVHNLNFIKSKLPKPTKIMAMVKAFSYGSGSTEIASLLQFHGIDYLGVAYLEEGVALRKSGISAPIMVMNPSRDSFNKLIKNALEPELYSLNLFEAFLEEIEKDQNPNSCFKIHLKIDTGMHRLGFSQDDLKEVVRLVNQDSRIEVASVFTHLAGADDLRFDAFSQQQIEAFNVACEYLQEQINTPFLRHILNSAGAIRFPDLANDMVRLGIGLYGLDSSKTIQSHLMPVTRFVTHISQIKQIEKGESVGYGRSFVAKDKTTIATLPVGYADGYYRSLGNLNSKVFIKGEYCPIVGNICMDMLMTDITGLDIKEGDEVELFGQHISVSELASAAGTISYEILAHISTRVPRVYLQN
mgnify:FL=1